MADRWTARDIPDQSGRVAIVTGANSGIGLLEQRGHPKVVRPNAAGRDEDVARRLWEVSEKLTGLTLAAA